MTAIDASTRRTLRLSRLVLVVAALLFGAVFVIRLSAAPDDPITVLYAVPIALVAVELGIAWGSPRRR